MFLKPVSSVDVNVGECTSNTNVSVQDGSYSYKLAGPEHYTDYYMNETLKTGTKYQWKNVSICMRNNTFIEMKYDFQDDLHTKQSIAYDPVYSFAGMQSAACTLNKTELKSLYQSNGCCADDCSVTVTKCSLNVQ